MYDVGYVIYKHIKVCKSQFTLIFSLHHISSYIILFTFEQLVHMSVMRPDDI